LHPDLKSLYFSSDGHYGLGDLDVFVIRRLSDTSWTSWSKPVNLGKNVNTTEADWGYRVSTSGQWAYFSAIDKDAHTKEDIYRLQLPPELRPEPVIALTGQLTDVRRKNVSAQIHWVNLETGEDVGVATSDPVTGQYFILLPSGGNYGYYADSGSYFSVSNHLDLTNDSTYRTITQDLSLYRVDDLVASGSPLRINNLFFDYDKSSLRPESFPELNRMAKIIRSHPDIHGEIMGHTDDQGPDDYNLRLSEARAKAVMDYLTSKGVAADRLQAKGYGETKPMLPNNSEANRQMNRRVEFRFFR
jgi:outer membrane protein OmpA-like peptidoglycan-associated protein